MENTFLFNGPWSPLSPAAWLTSRRFHLFSSHRQNSGKRERQCSCTLGTLRIGGLKGSTHFHVSIIVRELTCMPCFFAVLESLYFFYFSSSQFFHFIMKPLTLCSKLWLLSLDLVIFFYSNGFSYHKPKVYSDYIGCQGDREKE